MTDPITIKAISYLLYVTFLDTGFVQAYEFDSMANCQAAKPAVTRLYKALDKPVLLVCKKKLPNGAKEK